MVLKGKIAGFLLVSLTTFALCLLSISESFLPVACIVAAANPDQCIRIEDSNDISADMDVNKTPCEEKENASNAPTMAVAVAGDEERNEKSHVCRGNSTTGLTFDDFSKIAEVTAANIHSSGKEIIYEVSRMNLKDNKWESLSYRSCLQTKSQFPNSKVKATQAVWSPDGSLIAYVKEGQIWVVPSAGETTEQASWQLTSVPTSVSAFRWSPDSQRIAFITDVVPSHAEDFEKTTELLEGQKNAKVKAIITETLMYRVFNEYRGITQGMLFVVKVQAGAVPKLVTQGLPNKIETDFVWHPKGTHILFTSHMGTRDKAWSTNVDVMTVDLSDLSITRISNSDGADSGPQYSPDGERIFYLSMETPQFESDYNRVLVYDVAHKTHSRLFKEWIFSPSEFVVSVDGRHLYLNAVQHGRSKIFISTLSGAGGEWSLPKTMVFDKGSIDSFKVTSNNKYAVWVTSAMNRAPEVVVATFSPAFDSIEGMIVATSESEVVGSSFASLHPTEDLWFKGHGNEDVHALLILPPQLNKRRVNDAPADSQSNNATTQILNNGNRKFPLLVICHGGPQVPALDKWSRRWNLGVFASWGVVVMVTNFHGSPGYGQEFTNSISGNWGGAPADDIMLGVEAAISRYPMIDGGNVGVAGGSFGGYMTNWLATQHADRFKAFFTHAGIYSLMSPGSTDEIFFSLIEQKTLWPRGGNNLLHSPEAYGDQLKKPHLIVHGELDYRCLINGAVSLFSALQYKGIPSKLIIYPDEGHWITKPLNSKLWYNEVEAWFRKYLNIEQCL